jgi:hypothetical protein
MRPDSILITAILFVAFIPGVLLKLGSGWGGLLIHGLLFAVVAHYAMRYYHRYIIFREGFGNFGPTCPNGYVLGGDQVCRPTGQQTGQVNTGFRPNSPQ